MRWATGLICGLGLSLAAGAALACPDRCDDPTGYDNAFDDAGAYDGPGEAPYDDEFGDEREVVGASPWYRDGRRPAPPCAQACAAPCGCDSLRLANNFFYDAGGVGPIPS